MIISQLWLKICAFDADVLRIIQKFCRLLNAKKKHKKKTKKQKRKPFKILNLTTEKHPNVEKGKQMA